MNILNILSQYQPLIISILGGVVMALYHKLPIKRQEQILEAVKRGVFLAEEAGTQQGISGEQKKALAVSFAKSVLGRMGYKVTDEELGSFVDSTVQAIYNFEKVASVPVSPIGFTPTPVVVPNTLGE